MNSVKLMQSLLLRPGCRPYGTTLWAFQAWPVLRSLYGGLYGVVLPWPHVAALCFLSLSLCFSEGQPLLVLTLSCHRLVAAEAWVWTHCTSQWSISISGHLSTGLCLLTSCRSPALSRHLTAAMEPATALTLLPPELSPCRLRGSLLIYEEVERQGQAWLYMPLISAPERRRLFKLCEFKASLLYTGSSWGYMQEPFSKGEREMVTPSIGGSPSTPFFTPL